MEKPASPNGLLAVFLKSALDLRLWIIVIPSFILIGFALHLTTPWLGSSLAAAITLVDAHLLNKIESFPKPDGKELVKGLFRSVLVPAVTGIFLITNADILTRVWYMPGHWFQTSVTIPSCSYLVSGIVISFIGLALAAVLVALLTKEHALFSSMVGLAVYIPLSLTEALSSGATSQAVSTLFSESCHLDIPSDATDMDAYRLGMATGAVSVVLVKAFLVIFVTKLVSVWRSRQSD
jgi:hypothetical protein